MNDSTLPLLFGMIKVDRSRGVRQKKPPRCIEQRNMLSHCSQGKNIYRLPCIHGGKRSRIIEDKSKTKTKSTTRAVGKNMWPKRHKKESIMKNSQQLIQRIENNYKNHLTEIDIQLKSGTMDENTHFIFTKLLIYIQGAYSEFFEYVQNSGWLEEDKDETQ